MPDADTVVFIPAWNEERSLPDVLAELRRREGISGIDEKASRER